MKGEGIARARAFALHSLLLHPTDPIPHGKRQDDRLPT
jgi:proline racemase